MLRALDMNGQPFIKWRIGLGRQESLEWLPWQQHYVFRYSAEFKGVGTTTGYLVKLITCDLLHFINRAHRTQAHLGTISSIVQRLAVFNNLSGTVVEDTLGTGIWIQSYQGTADFIRKRLLPRARSTRRRGNYYLFMRDNVLHFHTIDYQTTVKAFNYYASAASRLEVIDTAQDKVNSGAAGVRTIYHDPYTGLSKLVESDPNKALRLANTIPRLNQAVGTKRNVLEHRVQIRDEEAGSTALAQNAYESARSECFQVKFLTSMTTLLRPGEVLHIDLGTSSGSTSIWNGLYLIAKADHQIDHAHLESVYILQRGEQSAARTGNSSSSSANYGSTSLVADQTAPGYDLNVREAQSSSATRGAGKAASDGAHLKVQDRNAAPKTP